MRFKCKKLKKGHLKEVYSAIIPEILDKNCAHVDSCFKIIGDKKFKKIREIRTNLVES
jgi:hypothetical protein